MCLLLLIRARRFALAFVFFWFDTWLDIEEDVDTSPRLMMIERPQVVGVLSLANLLLISHSSIESPV